MYKISFQYKFLDGIYSNIYLLLHSPFIIGFIILVIGIGFKPNWRAVTTTAGEHSLVYRIVLFIILELVPLAIGFLCGGIVLLLSIISKMNKYVYSPRTYTFNDEMISCESAESKSEMKWSVIRKVARNKKYLFLYVHQHGAICIPKRAFESDTNFNQFFTYCRNNIKVVKAVGAINS